MSNPDLPDRSVRGPEIPSNGQPMSTGLDVTGQGVDETSQIDATRRVQAHPPAGPQPARKRSRRSSAPVRQPRQADSPQSPQPRQQPPQSPQLHPGQPKMRGQIARQDSPLVSSLVVPCDARCSCWFRRIRLAGSGRIVDIRIDPWRPERPSTRGNRATYVESRLHWKQQLGGATTTFRPDIHSANSSVTDHHVTHADSQPFTSSREPVDWHVCNRCRGGRQRTEYSLRSGDGGHITLPGL